MKAKPFITVWKTTQENESITILTRIYRDCNYLVDWGDGTTSKHTEDAIHIYKKAGLHEVKITGIFPSIYSNFSITSNKLIDVKQWGTNKWESMVSAFAGCKNINISATDSPDLSSVTDMRFMFAAATSFNGDISNWDVSNVTDMFGMFSSATSFNSDISSWDVSNVTDMFGMFFRASLFNQDLSKWNVSNVTDMNNMFYRTKIKEEFKPRK